MGYDETPSAVPVSFRRAQSTILCSYFAPTNGDELATFQEQARQQVLVSNFADNVRMYGEGANIGAGYVPSLDWKNYFWGENYEDLLKIKIKYDPDNLILHILSRSISDHHLRSSFSSFLICMNILYLGATLLVG